jgi:xanthine dehydrogenase accessory factor
MGETSQIVSLWRRAQARDEAVCLATVVHVEGSSYRKPGARMLITAGGERAGSISGGCLEGEISRKAWWLTADGPAVQRYQSSFDEDSGGIPWGLGCGGTVWVLLERNPETVLSALAAAQEQGQASVVLTRLYPRSGTVRVISEATHPKIEEQEIQAREIEEHEIQAQQMQDTPCACAAEQAAAHALAERRTLALYGPIEEADAAIRDDGLPQWFVEYLAPPPRLHIFGAGDDAQPIARFAEELGWRVRVADGRANLLRPERFPAGTTLDLLRYQAEASDEAAAIACGVGSDNSAEAGIPSVATGVAPGEFVVLLTHSWDQDRALARALLPAKPGYLGILGPRHRTQRLLEQVAPHLGWPIEACWAALHAPVGLDLGARDPAAIALSIVAELQATLTARSVTVRRAQGQPTPVPHG